MTPASGRAWSRLEVDACLGPCSGTIILIIISLQRTTEMSVNLPLNAVTIDGNTWDVHGDVNIDIHTAVSGGTRANYDETGNCWFSEFSICLYKSFYKVRELAEWLSGTSFDGHQTESLSKLADQTGKWFLRLPEFQRWTQQESTGTRELWCTGNGR
jgi:hypothetical protein